MRPMCFICNRPKFYDPDLNHDLQCLDSGNLLCFALYALQYVKAYDRKDLGKDPKVTDVLIRAGVDV